METLEAKVKVVWAMTERGDRTSWSRVGVAWEGEDGALFARLDAVPMSGRLCIQRWTPEEKPGQRGVVGEGGAPC